MLCVDKVPVFVQATFKVYIFIFTPYTRFVCCPIRFWRENDERLGGGKKFRKKIRRLSFHISHNIISRRRMCFWGRHLLFTLVTCDRR